MAENRQQDERTAGEKKTKREERKDQKRLWKEAKKTRREKEKEYYRYAPKLVRAWNLYLKKPVVIVLICAILVSLFWNNLVGVAQNAVYLFDGLAYDRELSDKEREEIYVLSPVDPADEEKIESFPSLKEGESWTVAVYIVGADLEDGSENDLSYVTYMLSEGTKAENESLLQNGQLEALMRFDEELKANGLELPQYFYYPEISVEYSEDDTEAAYTQNYTGAASGDIEEILSDVWSDNIQVVIQTGGATHWDNYQINPNRTQRFLYSKGAFSEIENLALQHASDPGTLSDFMRFCADEYPADHTMLVLWDHGSGAFGYGVDSIYGDVLSTKEIRSALEDAFGKPKEPPYDIIGFDACLMSSLEVTEALYGYADYYAVSEEVEPGNGWDYGAFLSRMTEDETMSPAMVARAIADTYTDYYIENNLKNSRYQNDVTFSVIEANAAHELYQAYEALCRAQLKDAVDDFSVLTQVGLCAQNSTRFGVDNYKVFNSVDLGNYAELMAENYPGECARITELIDQAVLYHRENGSLCDATGIAVYLPAEVNDIGGLDYFLDYVYNISESDDITALYYYKQAGCLNEELTDYVKGLTGKEPEILDVAPLQSFSKAEVVAGSDHFMVPVEAGLMDLVADYTLEVGSYDEDAETVTYYGRDRLLHLSEEGNLISDFDGKWIFLDDVPLSLEITSSTSSATEYRSHVQYNWKEAYLMLSLDKSTGKVRITGVKEAEEAGENATYVLNARSGQMPEEGSRITPIYETSNVSDRSVSMVYGSSITYKAKMQVERKVLPKGYYLCAAVLSDPRGDAYYSKVVGAEIAGSGMKNWEVDDRFYGQELPK